VDHPPNAVACVGGVVASGVVDHCLLTWAVAEAGHYYCSPQWVVRSWCCMNVVAVVVKELLGSKDRLGVVGAVVVVLGMAAAVGWGCNR